jgi:hypothetical protein
MAEGTTLKRRGILAAAGAVVAGIAMKQTSQRVAADGTFSYPGTNTASAATVLNAATTYNATYMLSIDTVPITSSTSPYTSGLLVYARGSGFGVAATANDYKGTGVYGMAEGPFGTGVLGDSESYYGVAGTTTSGIGVVGDVYEGGHGTSNIGVIGRVGVAVPNAQNKTTAVYGQNAATGTGGVGVVGTSASGYGASFLVGQVPLRLVPGTVSIANLLSTGHQAGEFYVTSDEHLMFFTGVAWRELAFVPPNAVPQAQPVGVVQSPAPAPLPPPKPTMTRQDAPNPLPPARP